MLRHPPRGILFALLAYSSLSVADALVKSLGGKVAILQIGFFTTFTALIVVAIAKPRSLGWREALRIERPAAVLGRAVAGLSASFLGIIAFTRLPLGEAYALMFLAPFFAAILAGLLLGERLARRGWLAIGIGLGGVLLVVRPGFAALVPAHGAALGVAISTAIGIIAMRTIAARESRTAVLVVLMAMAAASYAVAAILTGQTAIPAGPELARLAAAGTAGALGQILLLRAAALAPASRIAPAQYIQLIWASLAGALLFAERADALKLAGLLLIAAAGLLLLRERPDAARGMAPRDPID